MKQISIDEDLYKRLQRLQKTNRHKHIGHTIEAMLNDVKGIDMYTQQELDGMSTGKIKMLLSCGLHGKQHSQVMREYLNRQDE